MIAEVTNNVKPIVDQILYVLIPIVITGLSGFIALALKALAKKWGVDANEKIEAIMSKLAQEAIAKTEAATAIDAGESSKAVKSTSKLDDAVLYTQSALKAGGINASDDRVKGIIELNLAETGASKCLK